MSLKERLYRFRSFWIFPSVAILLFYLTTQAEHESDYRDLLWLFPIGLLGWTLLEYGLHRFIFHIQLPLRNPILRDIMNASHLGHHAAPRDPTRVLVHPSYGLMISAVLYVLLYVITRDGFSATGILAGVWTGFLYYEAVHYRVHFSLSGGGLVARQRRAHFHHHFTNNKRCFGVTSPLWDYVFRTTVSERTSL